MDSDYVPLPSLTISIDKAKEKVQLQIEEGCQIRDLSIKNEDELEETKRKRYKWSNLNKAILTGIFGNRSIEEEYSRIGTKSYPGYPSLSWQVPYFRKEMDGDVAKLESVLDKIELIAEMDGKGELLESEGIIEAMYAGIDEPKISIVHGTDPINARYQLKNLLTDWGIEAIILHEQSNRRQTIIEKFEEHSDRIGCAIVLLTPDDEGEKDIQMACCQEQGKTWYLNWGTSLAN